MVVQFAAGRFLPPCFLHAIDDHRQFEFIKGPGHAEDNPVLRIGGVVDAVFVHQQDILMAAEADQLIPVLVVADQARQFACGDGPGLSPQHAFDDRLVIIAPVKRAAAVAGVAAEQTNTSGGPTELFHAVGHLPLAARSFHVPFDLSRTALP